MRILLCIACCTATIALAGCDGENRFINSDPVGVNRSEIYDAVIFEVRSETGVRIDVIEQGGRFELALDEDAGEFDSDFEFRGTVFSVSGTFVVEEGEMVFSDDPLQDDDLVTERAFRFIDQGDVIFLDDLTAAFDIDNDGTSEVVELRIRLELRD